ncbi:MAG: pseudouridine synthase [Cyanobacteria bacterium QS_7_48_42]|jgi:23S rRNA pseudouridine2605 synthase|nr:MAG: pseudouridine synthase [Cyanobacteria bacterium QH_7_48_89]PSO62720.1 MAG: pseudouridine synthase [Cyanobacteria bacterium QH_6_48_35]PSO70206.1 MAG: pseudouridine synthase [Cyanobacteria bacterium QH_3_48_40]PSO70581.1 MAG: pseudouridine synthase [Cyanobacteria bacterium QS_1_48_34]PSO84768.1 MAG: pseudouridine synthase [Cyanobacteria bacterium QS_5_48_63]PSO88381.1 MAG: pseudouridine synthase [Cyanobacteria bacterium QH_9_48_43]PSO89793.1 MAG: pseudouridine synthase [Cyanobacteria b
MTERVQKILSQWGIASRRQAEQMILAGRVQLNGSVVRLGQKADSTIDQLEVDGLPIKSGSRPQLVYLLLNKPAGVVSTCSDPRKRPTVIDLLSPKLRNGQGIHPVGRLDTQTTGALLLTNDGALTMHLTHPRYHLPKTYHVWVQNNPSESVLEKWRQGVVLAGKKTLPARVKVLKRHSNKTLLEIVLTEGRNRQIRRVAEQLGFKVIKLHRTAIGSIPLQPPDEPVLHPGKYRFLKDGEIRSLKKQSRSDIESG